MPLILIIGVIHFSAAFIYSLAGFGNALIAMPFLISLLGVRQATPLMSIVSLTTFTLTLIRYRRQITPQAMWRLILAAFFTVPVGVFVLSRFPEMWLQLTLGILIIIYAGYRLFNLPPLPILNPKWAYVFGGLAGAFAGAFNGPGPAAVIYADAQDWQPAQFRTNIASLFFFVTIFSVSSHTIAGNYTRFVVTSWLTSIPFLFLGLGLGWFLEHTINRARFRQIVLVLLLIVGLRMAFVW